MNWIYCGEFHKIMYCIQFDFDNVLTEELAMKTDFENMNMKTSIHTFRLTLTGQVQNSKIIKF